MKYFNKTLALIMAVFLLLGSTISVFADDQFDLANATITFNDGVFDGVDTSYDYTGEEIIPSITVNQYGTDLVVDTDYTVSYINNVNAGTATLIVNAAGSYTGSVSKEFKILPLNIATLANNSSIKVTADLTVAGKSTNVYVTKTSNNNKLVKNVDYQVETNNNAKCGIGTAELVLKGIGNYTGIKKYYVNVYPNKVENVKISSNATSSVKLTWNSQANEGVTGYKVYTCDSNYANLKPVATTNTNSCTVSNLKNGTYCYFVVRAYYTDTVKNRTIYSPLDTQAMSTTKPAKNSLTSVGNKDKTKVIIKWTKVNCSGYQVQYGTKSDFSNAKTITIKGASNISKTITVSKNSTKYYVRVRGYKALNGTNYYGAWSATSSNKYSVLYSTYTSSYVNNANRTTNLRIASKAINGTILQPGETFSFNKVVGKRTAAKGYKEAHVFTGPNSMTEGIGGGVCQVASTIFNAALLGNFKIAERHQHSQRVAYVPLGRDAAIYWGSEDFKFTNNTNSAMMIKMNVANGKITCSIYTCEAIKPKKVSLKVSRSGKNFTLRRYVGGKVNYTTKSYY